MPENPTNDRLNQSLIDLARSLLQYVGDCGLWTSAEAVAELETIDELVARQMVQIGRLADLLAARQTTVDFGQFPPEYGELHYVALDFILDRLISNQQALVSSLEETAKACSDDPEVAALLQAILAEERENVNKLRQLANSQTAEPPQAV